MALAQKFWHTLKYSPIYTYIAVKFHLRSWINVWLTESYLYNMFCIERSPKMWFWCDFGGRRRYLVRKYIRPQNCAISDIFGPDLTRRAVAFIHRRKFGQVWGSPAPSPKVAGNLRRCRKAPFTPLDKPVGRGVDGFDQPPPPCDGANIAWMMMITSLANQLTN